jgi:hypothetical protein
MLFNTYSSSNISNDLSYNTTQTSDNTANLVPYKCIYIKIKNDKQTAITNEDYGDYSFIIDAYSDFGDNVVYKVSINDIYKQQMLLNSTKRLEISFYDDKNNLITLNNWTLFLFQQQI